MKSKRMWLKTNDGLHECDLFTIGTQSVVTEEGLAHTQVATVLDLSTGNVLFVNPTLLVSSKIKS